MLRWRVIFMGWLFCAYCVYLGHCWCREYCSSFSHSRDPLFVLVCKCFFFCSHNLCVFFKCVTVCVCFVGSISAAGLAKAWERLWFTMSGSWSGLFKINHNITWKGKVKMADWQSCLSWFSRHTVCSLLFKHRLSFWPRSRVSCSCIQALRTLCTVCTHAELWVLVSLFGWKGWDTQGKTEKWGWCSTINTLLLQLYLCFSKKVNKHSIALIIPMFNMNSNLKLCLASAGQLKTSINCIFLWMYFIMMMWKWYNL